MTRRNRSYGYKSQCSELENNIRKSSFLILLATLVFSILIKVDTAAFSKMNTTDGLEFSRNEDGDYQAGLGNIKVTVRTYLDKVYVDIRDYFSKAPGQPVDSPTKRGVTMNMHEWELLTGETDKTYRLLQKIYINLSNDKPVVLPEAVNVTPDLKQAIEVGSNGPRVVLSKLRGNDSYATRNTASINLHPWVWFNIFSVNCGQINNLINLLEKEASLSAEKRKLQQLYWLSTSAHELFKATWEYTPEDRQRELIAQQKLFKATWDIPSLTEESTDRPSSSSTATTDLPSLVDETTDV